MSSSLNRESRVDALRAMQDGELDVLVVGGGIVGAGTALDAVTRGLRTGLVEAQDWASGTSSRSSKLIHGGLRYLEMMDFALVREALHERGLLVNRLAPHLVHPLAFIYPLTRRVWERAYVGAGVILYDAMASGSGTSSLPRHRHLSRRGALRLAPGLRADALIGAVQYYDAQVDDARHTMMVVRTAASHGALVASRTRVIALERSARRVTGARLLDLEGGREFVVRARAVISATGVWSDEFSALAHTEGPALVRASKGVHLLVARNRIALDSGLILRTETSVLFVIPWGVHWLIGTTDTEFDGDLATPVATRVDVDYLLEHVNRVLEHPLTLDDVQGVYAGLRPLLSGNKDSTSRLSREHVVSSRELGLVVVAGGKYTTYRIMASDAVDEAVRNRTPAVTASRTADEPLIGAKDWSALWDSRWHLASESGLDVRRIEHLLGRYGALTEDLLVRIEADPALGVAVGESDYLRVEVLYAVEHEGALHLEDVMMRRTHLEIESADHGLATASEVAMLMAPLLGWSDDDVEREIARHQSQVDVEWAHITRS